jgi:rhodanese-related sulfurtransferase
MMKAARSVVLLTAWSVGLPATVLAADPAPAAATPATASAVAVAEISVVALRDRLASKDAAPYVLDVRSAEEYATGHVPGAVNVPYDQVAARLAELPRDREIVLYCRSGRRAGLAADVLAANGFKRLTQLAGDMPAWAASGNPVEQSSTPSDKAR